MTFYPFAPSIANHTRLIRVPLRKKRYFTLNGPILCYFDAPSRDNYVDPSKPRGRLNLSKEDTVAEMQTKHGADAPTEFLVTISIHVLGSKRKWEMCAADYADQRRWYDKLRRYDGVRALVMDHFTFHTSLPSEERIHPSLHEIAKDRDADDCGEKQQQRLGSPSPLGRSGNGSVGGVLTKPAKVRKRDVSVDGRFTGSSSSGGSYSHQVRKNPGTSHASLTLRVPPSAEGERGPPPLVDRHTAMSWLALNAAVFFIRHDGEMHNDKYDKTFWLASLLMNFVVYHLIDHLNQRGEIRALQVAAMGGGGQMPTSASVSASTSASASASGGGAEGKSSSSSNARVGGDGNTILGPGGAKRASGPAGKRQSFVKTVPSCTTIPRAPVKPDTDLASLVNRCGPLSPDAVRAYTVASPSIQYDESVNHSFWNVDPSVFALRVGPNYRRNKRKAPSGPALYDLYGMEFVKADAVLRTVEDGFTVPDVPGLTDVDTGDPAVPPLFVVNTWLPAEEPSMFGGSDGDEQSTYVIVMYFVISERTLAELRDPDGTKRSPAVRLLAEWFGQSESDDAFRGRFKALGMVEDIAKTGLPSFIAGYNGKPALVSKSGTFTRHRSPSSSLPHYVEMSVNVRLWAYLAKKGLHVLKDRFPQFVLNVGFTIEGRSDEELPEVLLGGVRMLHLDPGKAVDAAAMAAGMSAMMTTTPEGENRTASGGKSVVSSFASLGDMVVESRP